jgi:hypothetical protein
MRAAAGTCALGAAAGEGEEKKKKVEGIIVTQGIVAVCPRLRMTFLRSQIT